MKPAPFGYAQGKRGFTLIELLVVISIIAILSVIGMTAYGNVQKSARDARRRGDIDAITKAMEVNKSSSGYQALQSSWFASNTIPKDPGSFVYCASWGNAPPSTPGPFTSSCPSIYWAIITANSPGGSPYWMVCASLESSATVYCQSNIQ